MSRASDIRSNLCDEWFKFERALLSGSGGRIPWADVDIMVLVEERGVPKFCLLELCSKVSVDSIE